MTPRRWTVWLFVWIGWTLMGGPGRAQDVGARLQAAWQAFKEARFEDTLRLAQVVLKSDGLNEAARIEALALQAYASVALGRLSTAEERFRAILQIQPAWTPPGEVASPRILRVFEQARQTSEAERALWMSFLARWTEAVRRDDWVEAQEVWRQVEQTAWRHPEVRRQVETLGPVWNSAWNELTRLQRVLRDMVLVPATPAASIGVGPTSRQVALQAFYMDAFPVTWERYAAVARAHGQTVTYPPDRARHPVVQVTWDEAQTFCAWEGKTLPTAEQWEYAARGPQALQFPWGRSFDPARCNTKESRHDATTPVDAYPNGRSPFGIWDLCGNAWEWTATATSDGKRVAKGGSFREGKDRALNYESRSWAPDTRRDDLGFRCALSADAIFRIRERLLTEAQKFLEGRPLQAP